MGAQVDVTVGKVVWNVERACTSYAKASQKYAFCFIPNGHSHVGFEWITVFMLLLLDLLLGLASCSWKQERGRSSMARTPLDEIVLESYRRPDVHGGVQARPARCSLLRFTYWPTCSDALRYIVTHGCICQVDTATGPDTGMLQPC